MSTSIKRSTLGRSAPTNVAGSRGLASRRHSTVIASAKWPATSGPIVSACILENLSEGNWKLDINASNLNIKL